METTPLAGRLIRFAELKRMVGLSKSCLYSKIAAGAFPCPIKLGPRSVAWVEAEVRQWIAQQIEASRQSAT